MGDEKPDRHVPLRLAVAARLAFPDGGVTASSLRREAARRSSNMSLSRCMF